MRSMPATLREMGLEASQTEGLEKPRKELEELLSIVTQRKCRAGEWDYTHSDFLINVEKDEEKK